MTSQNFHEDFTYYTNSIEAHAFCAVYVNGCIYSHCIHIACWVSFYIKCLCVEEQAVDLNNTVYCHLWLFKIGVVYLSPKPHQIRMSIQSKTLEVGVYWGHKRTRSKVDF